jgi:transcriptional regulator with XRE-family HTH domain
MPKKTPIGEKIFALRKALGLTQGALGEQVGVTRAAISQFEAGDILPSLTTLAKLSHALKVDLTEIWQASPNPSTAQDDHRLLSFVPISAYPSLTSMQDPQLREAVHTSLSQVPILRLPNVDYEGALAIEVNGDSMLPRYPHGSRYVIHQVRQNLEFATGVHLFLFHRERLLIRRIVSNKGGILTLRADATGEEAAYSADLLRKLVDEKNFLFFKLGQAIHLPAEA